VVGTPRTLIEVNAIDNVPSPLNLPATSHRPRFRPRPRQRDSNHTIHCHECASTPVKESPGFAIFVLMVSPTRTTRLVPAEPPMAAAAVVVAPGPSAVAAGLAPFAAVAGPAPFAAAAAARSRGGLLIWRGRIGLRRGARRLIAWAEEEVSFAIGDWFWLCPSCCRPRNLP